MDILLRYMNKRNFCYLVGMMKFLLINFSKFMENLETMRKTFKKIIKFTSNIFNQKEIKMLEIFTTLQEIQLIVLENQKISTLTQISLEQELTLLTQSIYLKV
jgi:hypothetical protein